MDIAAISSEDIQKHSGMVHKLASKRWRQVSDPAIAFEDLVAEANIGLLQAYERFDPDKGFAFSTFAFRTIDGLLQRFIQTRVGVIRYPAHTITLAGNILKAELEKYSPAEIAKALDTKEFYAEQALEYLQRKHAIYLDRPMDDSDSETSMEHLAKTSDDLTELMTAEFLGQLKPKFRKIVELKMQGYNGAEVGRIVGVSSERVRQVMLVVKERYEKIEAKGMKGMGTMAKTAKTGPDSGVTKQILLEKLSEGKSIRDVEIEYGMKLNTLPYWVKKWGLEGLTQKQARLLTAGQTSGAEQPPAENRPAEGGNAALKEMTDRAAALERSLHLRGHELDDAKEEVQRQRAEIDAIRQDNETAWAEVATLRSELDQRQPVKTPTMSGLEQIEAAIADLQRAREVLVRLAGIDK